MLTPEPDSSSSSSCPLPAGDRAAFVPTAFAPLDAQQQRYQRTTLDGHPGRRISDRAAETLQQQLQHLQEPHPLSPASSSSSLSLASGREGSPSLSSSSSSLASNGAGSSA